ncbi:MAG TPA: double zinc ribbon domain-containing protein [Gemmatimonadales bacterium]|jgi:ComF family protein|nr:double zinc ribbon domain-containing protein [Gemmatimonadales bacterium]
MLRFANPGRQTGRSEILAGMERWLLPAACLLCGEPVPERQADALICDLCRIRWRPIPHPLCGRCGQPSLGDLACRLCAEWPEGLARVRSAVWLEGSARDAVHRLKYDGWTRASKAMAETMRSLEPLTGRVSLIPVPLGRRRLRQRGYNQSECLAHALGGAVGAPVRTDLLGRVRETPTQTALTPEARHANVAGAFHAGAVRGLELVLVDDVFTTGATLAAAGAALSEAGAARVEAVTFARAVVELGVGS